MLAGSPVASAEVADFHFALIATQYPAGSVQGAKCGGSNAEAPVRCCLSAWFSVTLNFLFCMAYALFSLTLEAAPL